MICHTLLHLPFVARLRRQCCSRRTAMLFGGIALVMAMETAVFAVFAQPQPVGVTSSAAAMPPSAALDYIKANKDVVIVDLRTRKEFSGAQLRGALNIPMHSLFERIGDIPTGRPIVLHCLYGFRAVQAYKLLRLLRPDITQMYYVAGQIITIPIH